MDGSRGRRGGDHYGGGGGRAGGGGGSGGGRGNGRAPEKLPEVFSVHKGEVVKVGGVSAMWRRGGEGEAVRVLFLELREEWACVLDGGLLLLL